MNSLSLTLILLNLMILIDIPAKIHAFRVFDVKGVQTILALENEEVRIVCKTGMPMAYCNFVHPSGKRYSFSGNSLNDGQCQVKIRATKNDSGDWRCHIGKTTIGVEIKQDIQLRVVSQIAAIETNVTTVHGKDATLSCVSTKEKTPLKYCRFEPPNGIPFSIDSDVSPSKPILGKYYYPQNKSLDRGDCAVTIRKVKYSDVGAWICGADLGDGMEHTAVIRLDVEGIYTMSTASTTGITFGSIGIVICLAVLGFIVWKKRSLMGTSREQETIEIQELPAEIQQLPADIQELRVEMPASAPEESINIPIITVQSPSVAGSPPSMSI